MDGDRWDVTAKFEAPVPRTPEGANVVRKMLQGLLAERFGLKVHKEAKEMTVSALVTGKGGLKLKPSTADSQRQMRMGPDRIEGGHVDMPMLARALSTMMGRTVADGTGLTGEYDIQLQFAPEAGGPMMRRETERPEATAESDKPSLTQALQETLGLKLETRKQLLDTVVVDSAVKATDN